MGKGSRNRQLHLQEKMDNPTKFKKKQKKQMPKWLTPVIGLVLVAAILVGVVANIIAGTGIIKRSRIILDSQTGKFDVNQQMATFLVWQEIYYSAYTDFLYYQYGIKEDTYGVTKIFSSADQYALSLAQTNIEDALRDCVDSIMDMLKTYIAVCDEAERNGVKLDASEKETVKDSIDQLKTIQESYGYVNFNTFLKNAMGNGMKEGDIKDALELVSLYNKYTTQMQDTYEKAVTLADLDKFLIENPENYYLIDYLTYAAETEEFAKLLKDSGSIEKFKENVLIHHLDENYKGVYNKYTTTVTANDDLKALGDATGDALTAKLDEYSFEAQKTFEKSDEAFFKDKTALSDWLFNKNRKQYNTGVVTTDDAVYLVAFLSDKANTESVDARIKEYKFVDGTALGEDTKFKENIYEYIKQSKLDEPTYPEVTYKNAEKKADDFKKLLEATAEDKITDLLKENDAVNKTNIKSSTSATSTLPEAVIDAATASTVKAKDKLVANEGSTYYVIYVTKVEKGAYDFSYVTFKGDTYYLIIDDLTTSLNKVYPTDKKVNYDPEAEKDTFEAWISELTDKEKFTSARKEGDTNYFVEYEKTDKKDEENKTVKAYNVYMVVGTPMYLEKDTVVKGGYLQFSDKNFAEDAAAALETLKGKTNLELLNALSALNSSATTSTALDEENVKEAEEELSKWLFSDERKANDIELITAKDGKSVYLAVYVESMEKWQSQAKTAYVTEELQEWIDGLTKEYTPNEKVLNKIGKPTPTTEAETTTAAAETK